MNYVPWTICWLSVVLISVENARAESQVDRANHGDDRRIPVQILNIPGSGTDEEAIDYAALPAPQCRQGWKGGRLPAARRSAPVARRGSC